jgi:hypothetical protein
MSQRHAAAATRAARIIKARPEELYAAFMDPAALVAWLPPAEMTGQIHAFDARVGGGYRMSLVYPVHPKQNQGLRGRTKLLRSTGILPGVPGDGDQASRWGSRVANVMLNVG